MLGLNLRVAQPGQPMTQYHHEPEQEGFLVLSGEALLVIEGEERTLRRWDFVHCPPGAAQRITRGSGGPVRPVLCPAAVALPRRLAARSVGDEALDLDDAVLAVERVVVVDPQVPA